MFELVRGSLAPSRGAALVILAALGASFASGAKAKHSPMIGEPGQEAQQPAAPDDQPPAANATVIQGEFVESHDLLGDANDLSSPRSAGIQWSHKFVITLSGKKNVSEKWDSVRISGGSASAGFRHGPHGSRAAGGVTRQSESSAVIGENSGRAVWHVLADRKLERIFPGQHFLMMIDIEVGADNACHLDVKYLRQTGFVSVVMKQATTGQMANFNLPRVQSASCTIQ